MFADGSHITSGNFKSIFGNERKHFQYFSMFYDTLKSGYQNMCDNGLSMTFIAFTEFETEHKIKMVMLCDIMLWYAYKELIEF